MTSTTYRLLGYAVWHGGRWYLRQRLPSARSIALKTLGAGVAVGAAAALARRVAS